MISIEDINPWISLFIASLLEVAWAIMLHYSYGFQNITASVIAVFFAALSFIFLAFSVKHLPVGVAYVIWTGLGIVGTTIFSSLINRETTFPVVNYLYIFFILFGVYGLSVNNN